MDVNAHMYTPGERMIQKTYRKKNCPRDYSVGICLVVAI